MKMLPTTSIIAAADMSKIMYQNRAFKNTSTKYIKEIDVNSHVDCNPSLANTIDDWIKDTFPYSTSASIPIFPEFGIMKFDSIIDAYNEDYIFQPDNSDATSFSIDSHYVSCCKHDIFTGHNKWSKETPLEIKPIIEQMKAKEIKSKKDICVDKKHTKQKLPVSYIEVIANAIQSDSLGHILLGDIYKYVQNYYPYLCLKGSIAWKNSIRHNLSINDCFIKERKSVNGRGCFWTIHPACRNDFKKGDFNRRKARVRVQQYVGKQVAEAKALQILLNNHDTCIVPIQQHKQRLYPEDMIGVPWKSLEHYPLDTSSCLSPTTTKIQFYCNNNFMFEA